MTIEWVPVVSSNLKAIGYDPDARTLQVEFLKSGMIYEYDNVPPEVHSDLLLAQSHGSFFCRWIRLSYAYRRIR